MRSSLKDGVRRAEAVPQVVWSLDDAFSRLLQGGLAARGFGILGCVGHLGWLQGPRVQGLGLYGSGVQDLL